MKRGEFVLLKQALSGGIGWRGSLHFNIAPVVGAAHERHSTRGRILALVTVIATLASNLPKLHAQNSDGDACLAREGRTFIVGIDNTASYESKLFVTRDEIARYVFLTNANYDGDRSVAVYRVRGKEGSPPGEFWATATIASASVGTTDTRGITVRRYDAPIPMSTARAVHELWLAMLEGSRIDEKAIPLAPTAVISATTARGIRLKAVTVAGASDSPCLAFSLALMRVGQSLINYPPLPYSKRAAAARNIERDARLLMKRVAQMRSPYR